MSASRWRSRTPRQTRTRRPPGWIAAGLLLAFGVVAVVSLLTRQRPDGPSQSSAESFVPQVGGTIVAPHDGQVALLPLDGASPTALTSYRSPTRALDVTSVPVSPVAIASILTPPPGGSGAYTGELVSVDLQGGGSTSFVARRDVNDSLVAPVWAFDASFVLFESDDRSQPAVAYPRHTVARYPSRVERVTADGSGRVVVVDSGRLPAPSNRPDGELAFVRTDNLGTRLLRRSSTGAEHVLVDNGVFADIGSPRYRPTGDLIALMATSGTPLPPQRAALPWGLTIVSTAHAHGLPWDLWTIGTDGSNLQRVPLGADDGSLAWSPDGGRVFVYGDSGSFVVDMQTRAVSAMPGITGDGAVAWPR